MMTSLLYEFNGDDESENDNGCHYRKQWKYDFPSSDSEEDEQESD
jgi:hypothetical protein